MSEFRETRKEENVTEGNSTQSWEIPSYEESNQMEFELVDEDTYTMELTDIGTPEVSQFDPTGKKLRSQFTFTIRDDQDWEGQTLKAWYNLTLNERSSLYPVAKALMGGDLDPKVRITPDMLKGKQMKGVVVHKQDDQGRMWPRINSALPIRAERKGRSTPTSYTQADIVNAENPPF